MNKVKLVILVGLMAVLVSGCMQISQEVKVNRDGSAMMVEELRLPPFVVEMLSQFAAGFGGSEEGESAQTEISPSNLFPEEQFREKARRMGQGVEFVSREVKKFEEGMVGYVAKFKIRDINLFTLNAPEADPGIEKPTSNTPMTFNLQRGVSTSHLIIRQHFSEEPEKAKKETGEEEEKAPEREEELTEADGQKLAQLQQMLVGMRMQIVVQCGEEIESTNATWHDQNRIILVDFDMGELLSNPDKLKMLSQMKEAPKSQEDFMELLQGLEEIKFDLNPEIEVTFK